MYYDADYIRALEYGMPPTGRLRHRHRPPGDAAGRRRQHPRRDPLSAHAPGVERLAPSIDAAAGPHPGPRAAGRGARCRLAWWSRARPAAAWSRASRRAWRRASAACRSMTGCSSCATTAWTSPRRSERLQWAAQLLLKDGFIGAWRNENLEIRAHPDGPALAWIDRCAVRVLGITTLFGPPQRLRGRRPDWWWHGARPTSGSIPACGTTWPAA